jgi:N-acylneuraminate cytidylyltransferase
MKICVVPARGGSKRIPRKNIHDFCGKPRIAWATGYALQPESFDKVVLCFKEGSECKKVIVRKGIA